MSAVIGAQLGPKQTKSVMGVVVSSGLMRKTVKVRVTRPVYNRRVQKTFTSHADYLVHDPASAARLGDVVAIQSGYRASKQVKYLLSEVLTPVGDGLEQRPRIPTVGELLSQRQEKRAARDEKMLGVADTMYRLKVLESEEAAQSEGTAEAGVTEELKQLRESKDIPKGVAKGLNGGLVRLKEAGKWKWRKERAALTHHSVESLTPQYEEEAKRWDQRSLDWYSELHAPASKGRSSKWKSEVEWRASTAADIAKDCRRRIAEARAYQEQVRAFAKGSPGLSLDEAEKAMKDAQEELLRALCETLRAERGVYKAEIERLKAESNWLYSLEWLQDPAQPWRWQAHEVQLNETGRLRVNDMLAMLAEKGRNGPVWYAALREGLKGINSEFAAGTPVAHLAPAAEARRSVIRAYEANEKARSQTARAKIDAMKQRKRS